MAANKCLTKRTMLPLSPAAYPNPQIHVFGYATRCIVGS